MVKIVWRTITTNEFDTETKTHRVVGSFAKILDGDGAFAKRKPAVSKTEAKAENSGTEDWT